MSVAVRRLFAPGQTWDVTNHWITRVDHPSFGTTRRTVDAVNTSGLRFRSIRPWDRAETLKWPKSADLTIDDEGTVYWSGHPKPGMLFLTLVQVTE